MKYFLEYDIKANVWLLYDNSARPKGIKGALPPCILKVSTETFDNLIEGLLKILHAEYCTNLDHCKPGTHKSDANPHWCQICNRPFKI